jgi:hypothetical protein
MSITKMIDELMEETKKIETRLRIEDQLDDEIDVNALFVSNTLPDDSVKPIKRPVGRPRKIYPDDYVEPIKQPVGRPRKIYPDGYVKPIKRPGPGRPALPDDEKRWFGMYYSEYYRQVASNMRVVCDFCGQEGVMKGKLHRHKLSDKCKNAGLCFQ